MAAPDFIWHGIYSEFPQATANLQGFKQSRWQEKCLHKLQHAQQPSNHLSYEYPLVLTASLLNKPHLNILDFGGSLGESYYRILSASPNITTLNYHIIENTNLCAYAKDLKLPMQFYSNIDDIEPQHTEIVHIGSTLQYIESWQELLAKLHNNFKPQYFVFSDLMAGDIPTYASLQYYYGDYIPTWFWNLQDFTNYIAKLGYSLTYRSLYLGEFFSYRQPLPMQNFPQSHQLTHACNLVFKICT